MAYRDRSHASKLIGPLAPNNAAAGEPYRNPPPFLCLSFSLATSTSDYFKEGAKMDELCASLANGSAVVSETVPKRRPEMEIGKSGLG
jgi:hypothetical protein